MSEYQWAHVLAEDLGLQPQSVIAYARRHGVSMRKNGGRVEIHTEELLEAYRNWHQGVKVETTPSVIEKVTLSDKPTDGEMITITQAAELAGKTDNAVRAAIKTFEMPTRKEGRLIFVSRAAIEAWIAREPKIPRNITITLNAAEAEKAHRLANGAIKTWALNLILTELNRTK